MLRIVRATAVVAMAIAALVTLLLALDSVVPDALASSSVPSTTSKPFVIRFVPSGARIGPWRIDPGPLSGSLASAERAFGPYSRCTGDFNHATPTWDRLGIRADFWTLGDPAPNGCATKTLVLDNLVCAARRCKTQLGLEVGDPVAKLKRLYPRALWRASLDGRRSYWLVYAYSVIEETLVPRLHVHVASGRVSDITIELGLQGE